MERWILHDDSSPASRSRIDIVKVLAFEQIYENKQRWAWPPKRSSRPTLCRPPDLPPARQRRKKNYIKQSQYNVNRRLSCYYFAEQFIFFMVHISIIWKKFNKRKRKEPICLDGRALKSWANWCCKNNSGSFVYFGFCISVFAFFFVVFFLVRKSSLLQGCLVEYVTFWKKLSLKIEYPFWAEYHAFKEHALVGNLINTILQ